MAELFGKSKSTINEHIKNIFSEGELVEADVMKKFGIFEFQQKAPNYYNLDVIISVGYRVKSRQGTQFRIWATQRLKEYIIKGFLLDDERFTGGSSMNYFTELQERIREIRLSERFFYQKINYASADSFGLLGEEFEKLVKQLQRTMKGSQVFLNIERLQFPRGQQLLDWIAEAKSKLQLGEVDQ